MRKYLMCISFILLVTALVACDSARSTSEIDVIKFQEQSHDGLIFDNYVAKFIIEEGYGIETESVIGSTAATFQGLQEGDIHVGLEIWTANQKEMYEDALEAEDIVDLGTNFKDKGQGFYVPTYVIEGDPERDIEPMAPDLRTAEDLKDYPNLFENPEDPGRGRIINSPSGWTMEAVMTEKIETYGLDETMNNFIPGSDSALVASLVDAYEKGKPWVGYYWSPTWVTAKYDLTLLEEAEYDKEIWNKNKGTAYPVNDVVVVANKKLPKQYPEITEFLKNYEIGVDPIEEAMVYIEENDATGEETGHWWLE